MKKRLLFAALAMVCAMSSFALEIGEYAYTATQRVKITGENLVTNGNFAAGTDGWIDAAGEAVNADVWSFVEGAGPNGENVLQSMSGSTADAALCQKWDLDAGTYIVMYDIKGEAITSTYLTPGGNNNIDFFLTSTENPAFTRVDRNDGTVNVATPNGYSPEWTTKAYYFELGDGQSLVMHMEKLTANTQIANIQIYPADEVFDDRIIKNKLTFIDQLIATGKFTKDTENEFVGNIVETLRSMNETDGELDDKSAIEGMMESYEEEFVAWLNANGADVLENVKRWSSMGDTRKQDGMGAWGGTGGRWFHANNGGSDQITDNGDECGHRLQGRASGGNTASIYYTVTPKSVGTFMFTLDVTGYYMQGNGNTQCPITNVAPNYTPDYYRPFNGVTMYAGKDILVPGEDNSEKNIEQQLQKIDLGFINNPNPKQNCQRFVVFYEVSQDVVDAATPISFGISYEVDPQYEGTQIGRNVNIANPQIILIGETQDELRYKNEVAAIIVQQGPLKERLDLAKDDMQLTAADDRPWGHAALQEAIDTYQPIYDESLTIIDESGNVLNEGFIREKLAAHAEDETAPLYSADLLAAVQAMNSARNAFKNANNAIANYRAAVAAAELVLNDVMNATGNRGALQNVISLTKEKLYQVLSAATDDSREADEAELAAQLELLATAVEEFKATVNLTPFIDIDFANPAEAGPEGGMVIKGAQGEMAFAEDVYSGDNTGAPWVDQNKGTGSMYFGQGIGEELLDVLRVGNGEGTVAVPDEYDAESDVLRFNFDVWFVQLSSCNLWVNLLNEAGQRVAGFKYLAYNSAQIYNDFNNEEGTGMPMNGTSCVSDKTGDAGSCVDGNKSSFSLIINYAAKTLQGIVANSKATYAGAEVPFRTADDDGAAIEDTKIVSFVLGSDYKAYPARRCWFDNLQAYHYPTKARLVGDVGGDGSVDVADISAVITVMAEGSNNPAADVNGDGSVDVADISAIITIMATM